MELTKTNCYVVQDREICVWSKNQQGKSSGQGGVVIYEVKSIIGCSSCWTSSFPSIFVV
jgi:hypothetical protein